MDNTSNKSNEIDLRLVYNKIKQPFITLWKFIINIFLIIQKRLVLCICLFLFGIGAGIGLFFVSKPVYSSTMTISSSLLNNDFCRDEINELETLIRDNTPKLLAKKLKIDTNSAKEIKKVEFHNYFETPDKKYTKKDTVILGLPFKIKAYVSNISVYDTLQNAIVNYLENNPYALKRKEIKRQNIQLMREKLRTEIQQLDSLKIVVAAHLLPRGNSNGFVFGQPLDPINVYREGISLYKDDLELNSESILIDNIQVINDFSPSVRPESPKLWKTIITGAIVGFLLGIILSLYLERKKN